MTRTSGAGYDQDEVLDSVARPVPKRCTFGDSTRGYLEWTPETILE
jgi:hypothetical protein